MITDDFNFTFDDSDFPVSIEEFAAYMDGNLADDEMQRVGTVIEHDDTMQGIMDSLEQSEQALAEYNLEGMLLPETLEDDSVVPEIDGPGVGGGGFFSPFAAVAACAANSMFFDHELMMNDDETSEAPRNCFEDAGNSNDNEIGDICGINEDAQ